jgi:hypothetical protein
MYRIMMVSQWNIIDLPLNQYSLLPDNVHIWYSNRQGIIHFPDFNVNQGSLQFPPFLKMLDIRLAQHTLRSRNPLLQPQPGITPEMHIMDNARAIDLDFYLTPEERTAHVGSGIPKKVYEIAVRELEQMDGHVPEIVWFHKFEETSTVNIRRALGIDDAERGSRVLYNVLVRKLYPIMKLSREEFPCEWWQVVVCRSCSTYTLYCPLTGITGHYILWEQGVRHCNIRPGSLMVYWTSSGRAVGVLTDYDLSSARDAHTSHERIGATPFIAIELRTHKAIKVEHLYRHDVESFIWVFIWVCLGYEDGELEGGLLSSWLEGSTTRCRLEKAGFLSWGRYEDKTKPSLWHQFNWEIAQKYLTAVAAALSSERYRRISMTDGELFVMWLEVHVPSSL